MAELLTVYCVKVLPAVTSLVVLSLYRAVTVSCVVWPMEVSVVAGAVSVSAVGMGVV